MHGWEMEQSRKRKKQTLHLDGLRTPSLRQAGKAAVWVVCRSQASLAIWPAHPMRGGLRLGTGRTLMSCFKMRPPEPVLFKLLLSQLPHPSLSPSGLLRLLPLWLPGRTTVFGSTSFLQPVSLVRPATSSYHRRAQNRVGTEQKGCAYPPHPTS